MLLLLSLFFMEVDADASLPRTAAPFRQVERIVDEVSEPIVIADDLSTILTHALAYGKMSKIPVAVLPPKEYFFTSFIDKSLPIDSKRRSAASSFFSKYPICHLPTNICVQYLPLAT